MKLEDALTSRYLMQSVNVLRDNTSQFAQRFPFGNDLMAIVWFCVGEVSVGFRLLPPIFVTSRFIIHEVIKVDRLVL
jgi:hypothetical protein